mgnify:CR=1 FL=1
MKKQYQAPMSVLLSLPAEDLIRTSQMLSNGGSGYGDSADWNQSINKI